MKKLTLALVAGAAIGIASPAFSQSVEMNYGSKAPQSYPMQSTETSARPTHALHRAALMAHASVPQEQWGLRAFTPQATGGGSIGYNEGLELDGGN